MSIVLRFHVWFVMTVYYKMQHILLQNATGILLQNAPGFLLKKCDSFIIKWDVYYKLRQYKQCFHIILIIKNVALKLGTFS